MNGQYLITDWQTPSILSRPSNLFVDGNYVLAVSEFRKGGFTFQPSSINLTFNNDITIPPVNTNSFTQTSGTTPGLDQPFVVMTIGDCADGANYSVAAPNTIASWNPNLFLFIGDVYEKGSPSEFYNWYAATTNNLTPTLTPTQTATSVSNSLNLSLIFETI